MSVLCPLAWPSTQVIDGHMEPPGVAVDDGRRVYASVLTGDWFQAAKASVPPGTKPKAYSIFWDDTVKTSTGAKYSLLQLYDNHLPLAVRFKQENIVIFGFVPIVRRPVACLRFAALSQSAQNAWLRADRAAVSNGVLKLILDGFAECGAGICVAALATELEPPPIYVPIPAVWWFDHPQHMAMCGFRQCGYCDVAMRGVAGLSDFGAKVELRKSKGVRELIDKLAAARQHAAADPPDGRAKQEAKLEVRSLAKILESERSCVTQEWHEKERSHCCLVGIVAYRWSLLARCLAPALRFHCLSPLSSKVRDSTRFGCCSGASDTPTLTRMSPCHPCTCSRAYTLMRSTTSCSQSTTRLRQRLTGGSGCTARIPSLSASLRHSRASRGASSRRVCPAHCFTRYRSLDRTPSSRGPLHPAICAVDPTRASSPVAPMTAGEPSSKLGVC